MDGMEWNEILILGKIKNKIKTGEEIMILCVFVFVLFLIRFVSVVFG